MDFNKRLAELTGLDIPGIIHGVIESFADKSSHSLEESRHAPRGEKRLAHVKSYSQISQCASAEKENPTPPSKFPSYPTPPHNTPTRTPKAHPSSKMSPLANLDDAAGFMAAARSLKMENNYGNPPAVEDTCGNDSVGDQETTPTHTDNDWGLAPVPNGDLSDLQTQNNNDVESFDDNSSKANFGAEGDASIDAQESDKEAEVEFKLSTAAASNSNGAIPEPKNTVPEPKNTAPEEEEDREQLTTFKTWGARVARDKPASQIRRVIIRGLPASWSTPDKVLSLVHGGMVESVNIASSGNAAYVLFCEHAACKAFYDKYPNGIDLDKERKYAVFVDLGKEPDVVSSQLEFNLSVGSTRVVRAVGVDMDVTMSQLVQVASANNRKVEKIIDAYVPNFARQVSFRFCSIEDAVRFRAALVREKDWEHCNVQYATDPCEVANGYHAD